MATVQAVIRKWPAHAGAPRLAVRRIRAAPQGMRLAQAGRNAGR